MDLPQEPFERELSGIKPRSPSASLLSRTRHVVDQAPLAPRLVLPWVISGASMAAALAMAAALVMVMRHAPAPRPDMESTVPAAGPGMTAPTPPGVTLASWPTSAAPTFATPRHSARISVPGAPAVRWTGTSPRGPQSNLNTPLLKEHAS